ncbi:MAG TPA: hypothetical protein VF147_02185, partial [Vicinamibacterales bacterium]
MVVRILICLGLLLHGATVAAQTPPRAQADAITTLVDRIEAAITAGDAASLLALGSPSANRANLEDFASLLTAPAPTRVVVTERDRAPLDGGAQRVILEIFSERGPEARLGTWRIDATPGAAEGTPWTIADVSRLSVINGLYHLSLDPDKQFDVRNLTVRAPDLSLEMSSGSAFVASAPGEPTAIVLLGKGEMTFAPHDAAEQTQIRIFSGSDTIAQDFDAAFIRVNPAEFSLRFDAGALKRRQVSQEEFRRASAVFDEYVGRTFQLDLSDLTRDRWSLTPTIGDLVAEVRTKKLGTLTYARSSGEAEDVSLFDRKRRKNISVYASEEKLASRGGRFYSEDDLVDYDVLAYDIEADVAPDRSAIAGVARVKVKIRRGGINALTMRLAETLGVRGVYSPQFGRLLHLRVIGQNSLIINLPSALMEGSEIWLEIRYSGRLTSQSFDREAIDFGQDVQEPYVPSEARYLYSNRSYWYPQATVTDYATAKLRITVPSEFDVVATGDPTGPPAPPPGVVDPSQRGRKMFVFDAPQPARYLAFLVTRLSPVESAQLKIPTLGNKSADLALYVQSNPRQVVRVRDMLEKSTAVFQFYSSIVGDVPYPSFTLALTESDRPGG